MSVFIAGPSSVLGRAAGLRPLVDVVQPLEHGVEGVIVEWLAPYYAAESAPAAHERESLPPGAVLVNRDGHQFSRFGARFHAPDPADTGILARQREIEALSAEISEGRDRGRAARERLSELETALSEHDEALAKLRAAGAALNERHHERELEHVKLAQSEERHSERSRQIEGELAEIGAHKAHEEASRGAADAKLRQLEADIAVVGQGL